MLAMDNAWAKHLTVAWTQPSLALQLSILKKLMAPARMKDDREGVESEGAFETKQASKFLFILHANANFKSRALVEKRILRNHNPALFG